MILKKFILHAKLRVSSLVARLRITLIGRHVTALLVDTGQGRLLVPTSDFAVGRKLAYGGGYDHESLTKYASFINLDSNVLIVGTHIGSILVPLARKARHIFGVEANPETFRLLEMNVQLNHLTNVSLYNVAAFNSDVPLTFLMSRHNTGGSKVRPLVNRFEFFYDNPLAITVQGVRLDKLFSENIYGLVIMDIEGAEYGALLGMQQVLSKTNVLVCELLPNHLLNVAGITFDKFMEAIPDRFDRFWILQHPDVVVGRPDIDYLYEMVKRVHYFGGADLVCQVS